MAIAVGGGGRKDEVRAGLGNSTPLRHCLCKVRQVRNCGDAEQSIECRRSEGQLGRVGLQIAAFRQVSGSPQHAVRNVDSYSTDKPRCGVPVVASDMSAPVLSRRH